MFSFCLLYINPGQSLWLVLAMMWQTREKHVIYPVNVRIWIILYFSLNKQLAAQNEQYLNKAQHNEHTKFVTS